MESGFSENLNEAQENLDQYNNLIDDKVPIPATNELYSIVDGFDSHSNYIVNIYANSVIPANELNELLHRKFDFNKPLNWFGQKVRTTDGKKST